MAASSVVRSRAVLRSGWRSVSPVGTAHTPTAQRNRRPGGRSEVRTWARTSSSPSLASSEGWTLKAPAPIHRRAPFVATPTNGTAASSATDSP